MLFVLPRKVPGTYRGATIMGSDGVEDDDDFFFFLMMLEKASSYRDMCFFKTIFSKRFCSLKLTK